jgi:large subunit ribosomal protein L33
MLIRAFPHGEPPNEPAAGDSGRLLRPFGLADFIRFGEDLVLWLTVAILFRPPNSAHLSWGRIAAMAKPKKKKEVVFLVCEESGDRNYTLLKKPGTPKLELNKYCARLRKHTKHIEKKK